MSKPSITKPLILSLVVTGYLSCVSANAGQEDFKLPIMIDSKTQFLDGKRKTSIFRDDVKITQGTLSINADELEVIASEGQGREVFIARGKPAVYSQQMDDGSTITAKANEIRYQVIKRTLELTGSAELLQDESMVKADKISFDLEKEQVMAGSEGESRVTTVFQPEPDDDTEQQD